ncbi:MAG: hypothetical protein HYS12_18090 [Planctomycetes bacterium]|nr:hypothetical protein [Planctomycetota bacterium]
MRRALVLVLSVWAALPASGRAQDTDESLVRHKAAAVVVNGHVAPGGCPTCGQAVIEGEESGCCRHDVRRPRLSRIFQWATYRPLPTSGCDSCGSCRSCGLRRLFHRCDDDCQECRFRQRFLCVRRHRLFHGCGGCCKECAPCCNPPPYTYFLHRCPCHTPVHHYPVVYKTWEGKWPRAYAGPDDQYTGIYTDEDRLTP